MTVNIVVDNREKKPYKFPGVDNVIYKRLDVGDYTYEGFEHVFAVERKTLNDLATSVGSERERFEKEMVRSLDLEDFAVVIESSRNAVADYAGTKYSPNYYSKIYPNSILGTERSWTDKYDHEWHWADTRQGGKQETLRLLDKWYLKHGTSLY